MRLKFLLLDAVLPNANLSVLRASDDQVVFQAEYGRCMSMSCQGLLHLAGLDVPHLACAIPRATDELSLVYLAQTVDCAIMAEELLNRVAKDVHLHDFVVSATGEESQSVDHGADADDEASVVINRVLEVILASVTVQSEDFA